MKKRNNFINLLYPPFAGMIRDALYEAHQEGYPICLFEGYRSPRRQQFLYDQGRTSSGNIVTNAKPGRSWHQYGLAADFAFDAGKRRGVQWTWEGNFDAIAKIFKRYGMAWLGDTTSDKAHFQHTRGMTIKDAEIIINRDGIMGVWDNMERIFS